MSCPICRSPELESFDDLRRCARCAHVFQYPAVITARYDADYVATYDRYPSEQMSLLRVGFLKAFAPRGRLLDVGYGNGAFVRAAEAAGFEAFGCDVHGLPRGVKEIDLATDRSTWDVVTCFDSLEHVADFSPLRALWRRTRRVLVSAPLTPPRFPGDRDWKHYKAGEHLHYFSPESLARLVAKPLIAETDVEDLIRRPPDGAQNIYTAIYGDADDQSHEKPDTDNGHDDGRRTTKHANHTKKSTQDRR